MPEVNSARRQLCKKSTVPCVNRVRTQPYQKVERDCQNWSAATHLNTMHGSRPQGIDTVHFWCCWQLLPDGFALPPPEPLLAVTVRWEGTQATTCTFNVGTRSTMC